MFSHRLAAILMTMFLLVAPLLSCSPLRSVPVSAPAPGIGEQLSVSTIERSLAFVPNVGQSDPVVLFRTLGSASTLFFTRHEVVLTLLSTRGAGLFAGLARLGQTDVAAPAEPAVLRLRFEGANPDAEVLGEERLPGVVNYFVGDDPAKWHTSVPTYEGIAYEQLYSGIDLLYDGSEGLVKGTYLVSPGSDPGDIRWRYDGASKVELSGGELLISMMEAGETAALIERKPVAWQMVDGERRSVTIRYVIHRDGSIGFAVGRYDSTRLLMIDPTLDYSTYVGGSGGEGAYGIALDSSNNVHIAGRTNSTDFPLSSSSSLAGDFDIFVTKLDPSQTGAAQHVYTTYIGGTADETAHGIAVDSSGNACVGGWTASANFPVTASAFQQVYRGHDDAIAIQLDSSGAVQYASYLGGTDWEDGIQVAVGDDGLMYLTGDTNSTNFPTTSNAYQDHRVGDYEAFVTVVDPSKSGAASLVYSTYYGGSGLDEAWAIDTSDGIVYFAGSTRSADLPLKNPIQAELRSNSGWGNAYIAKLDPSLSGNAQLLYATYLGGTGGEVSGGIAVDGSGNMYLCGATESADFPTTDVSPEYGGGDYDGFLVKLNAAGSAFLYSTLSGGAGNDGFRDLVLDGSGNAYVTGATGSADFPTVNPIQDTLRGGVAPERDYNWLGPGDACVAGFDATGTMTFGTYLGGTGAEASLGIALDAAGNVYVAGATRSTDMDTVNPYQSANEGGYDAFVASIGGLVPTPTPTPTPTNTPTDTPTPTSTPTDTPTPTSTPTPTPTDTPTPTPTDTPTATPTSTPTTTPTPFYPLYLPLVVR